MQLASPLTPGAVGTDEREACGMNPTEVKNLKDLLQQAMASAVIRDSYRGSPISTAAYLQLLASHRQSFDADERLLAARFQPQLQDISLRIRLLDVIHTTLGRYIHKDMLQSATIVTGGVLDGFKVSNLMNHLITIAFCRGAEHASRSFYACSEGTSVDMQFLTLLDGITVERVIDISDGIRLAPIPDDTREFPAYILPPFSGNYMDYYGRTLIIVDEQVFPIFAHPSKMSKGSFPGPFTRSITDTVYPAFIVSEFCEALSLGSNHLVSDVAWWTHFDPDEAYAVTTTGRYPAYSSSFHTKNPAITVNAEDVRRAMSLYRARSGLRSEVSQQLRIPIDRWKRSKGDANPVDVFINLGTALESLYLSDTGNVGEYRFRMALRAAWHLGTGRTDRSSLFADFKRIYDRRSKAVHTGNLRQSERAPEFMARAQKLCLEAIVKTIKDGEFPDWDQLVMGE